MNKKIVSVALVLVLVLSICASALAVTSPTRYVVTANGKTLNFRSSPHTHSNNKIGNIPFGAGVVLLKTVNGGEWAYIRYDNDEGYVVARYLSSHKPAHKPTAKPTTTPSHSTFPAANYSHMAPVDYNVSVRPSTPSSYVHMRWAPSKRDRVMRDYYAGAVLEVIAQDNTWAQVRDRQTGAVGFMMRAFLVPVASEGVVVGSSVSK